MDVRGAYLDRVFGESDIPSHDEIRTAVVEEFNHLKRKAVFPSIGLFEYWQFALSKKLGRPAEDIVESNLLASDFSASGVCIRFRDGTELAFRHAFYVGDTPADGGIHRVAVFTEHCGYHEFRIGPGDRVSEGSLRETSYKASSEDLASDLLAPIGRDFGSPDYDRLEGQDSIATDLIEIQRMAAKIFETDEESFNWLHRPHPLLNGASPLESAASAMGSQRVKDILIAIQHGGVA